MKLLKTLPIEFAGLIQNDENKKERKKCLKLVMKKQTKHWSRT